VISGGSRRQTLRLAELGTTPFVGSPPDFRKFIADETVKWDKVIKAVNIEPD